MYICISKLHNMHYLWQTRNLENKQVSCEFISLSISAVGSVWVWGHTDRLGWNPRKSDIASATKAAEADRTCAQENSIYIHVVFGLNHVQNGLDHGFYNLYTM